MKESYSQIQKRLGVELSELEWPLVMFYSALAFLGSFATYLHIKLLGAEWAALAAAYPLIGILLLYTRFRTLADRTARLQAAFEALVGLPSIHLSSETVLQTDRKRPVAVHFRDPVTGQTHVVITVMCKVFNRRPGRYAYAGIRPIVFMFESYEWVTEFNRLFGGGHHIRINEYGPGYASPDFVLPDSEEEPAPEEPAHAS